MGTAEKLKVAKEILSTSFIQATDKSIAHGLQFKYNSYPVEEEEFKGWVVDIIVKEAGYAERTIQQFKYRRPNNIDAKNMEYHDSPEGSSLERKTVSLTESTEAFKPSHPPTWS